MCGATWTLYTPLTKIAAGAGHALTPAGATLPANFADLQALGALGNTAAWTKVGGGDFITLVDGTFAYWDGAAWVSGKSPDPLDVTAKHPLVTGAPAATLGVLTADGTLGNGVYTGPAFTTGQYITLTDGSKASYATGAWSVGAAA